MAESHPQNSSRAILQAADFQRLFEVLRKQGYQVVGPTIRDAAIVYDELNSVNDLPIGWGDAQDGGTYRLVKRDDRAFFGYVVGPQSWKKFLHPPNVRLWQARRNHDGFEILPQNDTPPAYAFIGARACELHAIAIQDKIFCGGQYADPVYQARREKIFVVAVNCAHAGGTCFCASMQTGPRATTGFDLALTEIVDDARHSFVIESGSDAGADVLRDLPRTDASADDLAQMERVIAQATAQMGRTLETHGLKELLYRNYEHPSWAEVADRCLTCANCTMVCPTCFCATVEDVTDLSGDIAERWRKWDSCFTMDFSYIHGGSIRASAPARYRQWMTHKLATWVDQFGVMGCVGCGRCITWCPVGIDITAQARVIRESESMKQ